MVNIQTNINEGSVREKTVTTINYDVQHPTFNATLSRQPMYSFVVGRGIHTDMFGLYRDGSGKEIIAAELNVSFEEPTWVERLKIALAILFPSFGEKYGATLTKYGLKSEEIRALQPEVDRYNTQCGIGIQCEYAHPISREERVIPTSQASLVDKL